MFRLHPYLTNGSRKSSELIAEGNISRETLSNAYKREASQVIRLGRARGTRYATRQKLTGLTSDEFPVFRVDADGTIARTGTLATLAASESVWLPEENIIDGLPPEMHDIAPRGFLGRSFARYRTELDLPGDLNRWSDHHVLIALTRRGEDLPGNLVIGEESFNRYQALQYQTRTIDDFPVLSDAALAGENPGSSAGGEQPKFTVLVEGRHRIVKFATDATDNSRRWQDLLALEHLALTTLRNAGVESAESELHDVDAYRCLMVNRFDRIGINGRRAVMTLAAASGQPDITWADAAVGLEHRGLLSGADTQRIALLDAFGALIANTDRHQYNILLYPTETGYVLAPAFDQLSMAYAPPASGNLRNTAVDEARPTVNTLAVWESATALAKEFWRNAAQLQLTDSMQTIVSQHLER